MSEWAKDAIFYHVYPLGYCGAPRRNDLASSPVPRLDRLTAELGRIAAMGYTALYLGPLFESVGHGYDPLSWREPDRRLGDRAALGRLSAEAGRLGLKLVFDGVFNHTGREHEWFRALRGRGSGAPSSPEAARYASIREGASPCGDPFAYEGWAGHYDLVKLNLRHGPTKDEIIGAALSWIDDYDIDGIRLDSADCLDMDFLRELSEALRARKSDFWLMGEVVFGDYRKWTAGGLLDSVTNYECYKGLWSSLAEANYFEIAWSLKRQFGEAGIYRDIPLYSFADNHDVDRVASKLSREEQLYPLYCLLFTMPGTPSVYYGSERGARAVKERGSDWPLRPSIEEALSSGGQPDLETAIGRLAALRKASRPLRRGDYRELSVAHESFAFERSAGGERAVVALNASSRPTTLELCVGGGEGSWKDALDGRASYRSSGGKLRIEVPPTWARILTPA